MIIGLTIGLFVGAHSGGRRPVGPCLGDRWRRPHRRGPLAMPPLERGLSRQRRTPRGPARRAEPAAWPSPSADLARLARELDHESQAAEQRAAGLEDTREQLAGEFARLSTQALQQNNAQFLELADTKLKETRQAADGELAHRQEAIEQLLKPISEQTRPVRGGNPASRGGTAAGLHDAHRTDEVPVLLARPTAEGDPQSGHRPAIPADPRPLG